MAKIKLTDSEQVSLHISKLPENMQPAVSCLRKIILSIDTEIAEHIKWNSPAFYFSGEMKTFDAKEYKRDILVMNLRKDKIMCVLPTGINIKINTGILQGDYTDGRRMIYFDNLQDVKLKEPQLILAIKEWLTLLER